MNIVLNCLKSFLTVVNEESSLMVVNEGSLLTVFNEGSSSKNEFLKTTVFQKRKTIVFENDRFFKTKKDSF